MLDSMGRWGALLQQQIQTSEMLKLGCPGQSSTEPARARQSRGRGLDLGRIHRDETPVLILLARMLRKWCQCALHIVKRTAIFILILHGALGTFQSLLYMLCFLFPMDTTQVGKGCYPLVSISKPKFRTSQQFSHSPSLGSRGDE